MVTREAAWPGGVDSPDFSSLIENKANIEGTSTREALIGMAVIAVTLSIAVESFNRVVVEGPAKQ